MKLPSLLTCRLHAARQGKIILGISIIDGFLQTFRYDNLILQQMTHFESTIIRPVLAPVVT